MGQTAANEVAVWGPIPVAMSSEIEQNNTQTIVHLVQHFPT
jgi:hypothetical protein